MTAPENPADVVRQSKVDLRWLTDIAERFTAFTEAWELSSDIETPDGRTIRISGGELRYGVDLAVSDLRAVAREIPDMVENLTDLIAREAQEADVLITTAEQIRALPVGAIIMSRAGVAFQVEAVGKQLAVVPATLGGGPYWHKRDDNMVDLLKHGPFRVLFTPGVDRG